MPSFLKNALRSASPELFEALRSLKFFFTCRSRFWKQQQRFHQLLFGGSEIHVLSGPFQGLRYYNKTIWGAIIPKWIGCYEYQLAPVVREILAAKPSVIIDIGAAEGYYVVGFAKMLGGCDVIAFDIDPIARFRQRQLAKLNKVSNIRIRGLCSSENLDSVCTSETVVICDIEGGEIDLLDPERSPNIRHCRVLVECHRYHTMGPDEVASELSRRFASSHSIEWIRERGPDHETLIQEVPSLAALDDSGLAICLNEGRDIKQVWLWMKPLFRSLEKGDHAPQGSGTSPRLTGGFREGSAD